MSWAALLLTALGVAGCMEQVATQPKQPEAAAATPPPPKPPEVVVDLPTTGEITDYEDFTGRTVATRYDRHAGPRHRLSGQDQLQGAGRPRRRKGLRALRDRSAALRGRGRPRTRPTCCKAESHLKRLELDYQADQSRLVESKSVTREQFDLVHGRPQRGGRRGRDRQGQSRPGQAEPQLHQGARADQRPRQPHAWSTPATSSRPTKRS